MAKQHYRQIALAFPTGVPHLERAMRGINRYGRSRGWRFVLSPETHSLQLSNLRGWAGDGAICWINTPREAAAARRLNLPMVNLSGALADAPLPRVRVDYEQVGKLAAEHLIGRGFKRLAYYGLRNVAYAQLIGRGFVACAQRAGAACEVLEATSSIASRAPLRHSSDQLEQWLTRLQGPVGVMASHDDRARMVAEACFRLNLSVPHQVAVLGMNNDEIVCELCEPSLTSVARNAERVGQEAAALLERLMDGEPPPGGDVIVPPEAVVARASTDVSAATDPRIAAAMDYIRRNLSEPFGVEHVIASVNVSRRWLEYQFQMQMGCSPRQYISTRRIERACEMLAATPPPRISDVARACGFRDLRCFRQAFQRHTGQTPQNYRADASR